MGCISIGGKGVVCAAVSIAGCAGHGCKIGLYRGCLYIWDIWAPSVALCMAVVNCQSVQNHGCVVRENSGVCLCMCVFRLACLSQPCPFLTGESTVAYRAGGTEPSSIGSTAWLPWPLMLPSCELEPWICMTCVVKGCLSEHGECSSAAKWLHSTVLLPRLCQCG